MSFANNFLSDAQFMKSSLREKCPNTEFFLVRIFLYSDWLQEIRANKKFVFGHFSRRAPIKITIFLYSSGIAQGPNMTRSYLRCVCVCVCMCVNILPTWRLLLSARCMRHTWGARINDLVLWIWVLLPSSFISVSKNVIFHLQRRNSSSLTGEKLIWYIRVTKRWYILI